MKKLLFSLAGLFAFSTAVAQPQNPVRWTAKAGENQIEITATIAAPWHIYDMGPYKGGPMATSFTFELPDGVVLDGKTVQVTAPHKAFEPAFNMDVGTFAGSAKFIQKFRSSTDKAPANPVTIKGGVEWQACDDESCLPPMDQDFSSAVTITAVTAATTSTATVQTKPATSEPTTTAAATVATSTPEAPETPAITATDTVGDAAAAPTGEIAASAELGDLEANKNKSFWAVIVEAILWGFAALLTPCVFPMVPMTVSFFMKGSGNKSKGRAMASFYGLSIVALYTLPIAIIILVTYFVGGQAITADIFNWLATHWIPNVIFFLVFMLFAMSFFGAFEITMPSKLVNKSDAKADKGGFLGVFFMALTLVLVSFSCTGPIVGTILVKSTQGEIWEPIFTMLAFSAAFALPFTIFAFFPSMLQNLPKSGGWLNSVKVVLGFIELALGLKFLSVADQTYHWGILDRETYLALWIVIFALLGVYLLGKIRFKHDSPTQHVGVTRLFLSIVTFAFVVYLVPGMFGAPLKALSGYLPPMSTLDFNLSERSTGAAGEVSAGSYLDRSKIEGGAVRYSDFLHLPHGIEGFFDYKQGTDYARAVGKPVFLDFTGHGCVNCREMEANVWSDPQVLAILKRDYVVIALYVDDKKQLPESEWVTTPEGKVQKTIGKINATFQIGKFNVNAQPYYVLLDNNDQLLVAPRSYNLDVNGFIEFLENGVKAYTDSKQQ